MAVERLKMQEEKEKMGGWSPSGRRWGRDLSTGGLRQENVTSSSVTEKGYPQDRWREAEQILAHDLCSLREVGSEAVY